MIFLTVSSIVKKEEVIAKKFLGNVVADVMKMRPRRAAISDGKYRGTAWSRTA